MKIISAGVVSDFFSTISQVLIARDTELKSLVEQTYVRILLTFRGYNDKARKRLLNQWHFKTLILANIPHASVINVMPHVRIAVCADSNTRFVCLTIGQIWLTRKHSDAPSNYRVHRTPQPLASATL